MPNWDEDSPQLRQNLARIVEEISQQAIERPTPSIEIARRWQRLFMEGLKPLDAKYVGAFRGEPGLEKTRVRIGRRYGVPPGKLAQELREFERKLQAAVVQLDKALPVGADINADELAAIVDLCAWAHAEWVRMHPFANGNGRTARLWANFLAMRYGLPPFVRLRPRPDEGYEAAGAKAMQGEWKPTALVFRRFLRQFLPRSAD
ncbi:MAG: Fic family protein [Acidobacteria bacterium]|nr:Fic family protein [Acidobacteriota bacterium]